MVGVSTVLLVDDFPVQLSTWTRELQRASNKKVVCASNRSEALREAAEHRPQLAIVDLFLGAENGLDVTRDLKAANPDIYVIVVGADVSVAYAMAAMRAGADDVAVKPVRCNQLVQGVETGEPPTRPDPEDALTLRQIEWEHISRVLVDCNDNITRAAERLGIYRQSLQRKLRKRGRSSS